MAGMAEPQTAIELKVDKVGQLFDTLDPQPFRERDLDGEAEEFIVSWARELPAKAPLEILVHMPSDEAAGEQARHLGAVMQRYFSYRARATSAEIRELFRIGRYSMLIGLVVLVACITLGSILSRLVPFAQLALVLKEGLIILGWVANWRPIEIFLYDWWPLVRRRRLFERLAAARVTVRAADPAPARHA
jgi:hypothetical protein